MRNSAGSPKASALLRHSPALCIHKRFSLLPTDREKSTFPCGILQSEEERVKMRDEQAANTQWATQRLEADKLPI